jgi:hypothetical protein
MLPPPDGPGDKAGRGGELLRCQHATVVGLEANCIYRGTALITAGDAKQLPPTNF